MKSNQLVTFANKSIKVWRKRLRIDKKWEIKAVYVDEPYEEDPETKCICDDDKAQYFRIKLKFYPPMMEYADATIRSKINHTVCHELLHLVQWQASSFAQNVLSDKLWGEYLKHEEGIVSLLEEIFTNQRPSQGVKLTWADSGRR